MATTQDLYEAQWLMITRVAEKVVALQDQGVDLEQIRNRVPDGCDIMSWNRLITLDPEITAGEIIALATTLGTSPTWLLTGTDPLAVP